MNRGKSLLSLFCVLIFLAACSDRQVNYDSAAPAAPAPPRIIKNTDDPDMSQRLEKLAESLDKKRQENHIPGMALAVVKDDQLIYARGFGMANLEKQIPASPETLFAIGSTTKAFTTSLVAMLAAEGKMDWDDPVTKYLPEVTYTIDSKNDDEAVTIRDMLSHRSGFARMSMLWVGGGVDRDTIMADSVNAEPYAPFRERFYYNNVMYLGAGLASAKAAGTDWDSLLQDRLLTPLGMSNSTVSYEKVQQDPRLAQGYIWVEEDEISKPLPMRNLYNIAPAGAINSNVLDMAQWLRLNLANGVFEGERLIDEGQLMETRKPQITIGGPVSYGLGWFLMEWQGQGIVQHGGNIDGYSAMVALAPESNLGFVLLSNVTATPLQNESIGIVFDHLLGEEEEAIEEASTAASSDQTGACLPCQGEYLANFGPFKDAIFTVQEKDGKLHVDVPGQMLYELKEPNEVGKWFFALTDTISVMFEQRDGDQYNMLRMQQGGLNFEVPRKGVPIQPEIDVNELRKFTGSYKSKTFNNNVSVLIQNHRLALDVPGEMTFELHLPDESGVRRFRIRKDVGVSFNLDDAGKVKSLNFHRGDEVREVMERLREGEHRVPTLAEIQDLRKTEQRKAALEKLRGIQMEGDVRLLQAGVKGTAKMTMLGLDRFRQDMDFGKYGNASTSLNPEAAANKASYAPFDEQKGKFLEQARKGNPATILGDWLDVYEKAEVQGNSEVNGKQVHIVLLSGGETPPSTIYVDAETGDVIKQEILLIMRGIGRMPVTNHYEDYREVGGLRIPFRFISQNEQAGKTVIQFNDIEAELKLDPSMFVLSE